MSPQKPLVEDEEGYRQAHVNFARNIEFGETIKIGLPGYDAQWTPTTPEEVPTTATKAVISIRRWPGDKVETAFVSYIGVRGDRVFLRVWLVPRPVPSRLLSS